MAFGVSNSFKRGIAVTYSKQPTRNQLTDHAGRPHKKPRLQGSDAENKTQDTSLPAKGQTDAETTASTAVTVTTENRSSSVTAPSSPIAAGRSLLLSDAPPSESDLSSPPSSPPQPPSPFFSVRKPAFSFLKRKRQDQTEQMPAQALRETTGNAQKDSSDQKPLKQMCLDFGGATRRQCKGCGMDYIPSVREDAELHKDFCSLNAGGVDVGKTLPKDDSVRQLKLEGRAGNSKEAVVVISRESSHVARSKVQKVLEIVNAELGSDDLDCDRLWDETTMEMDESKAESKRKGFYREEKKYDKFKAFLHIVDGKCISFCLAEKISNAFPVIESEDFGTQHSSLPLSDSSSISCSKSPQVVLMGISRIWTTKARRGGGLAFRMLECARNNFFYGIQVPRRLVAFSQPTESGAKLARRWFGAGIGWHVYQHEST